MHADALIARERMTSFAGSDARARSAPREAGGASRASRSSARRASDPGQSLALSDPNVLVNARVLTPPARAPANT